MLEDQHCLLDDVGHCHGNTLFVTSKDPLQQIFPDAVELPNRTLTNHLPPTKEIDELGTGLVQLDDDGVGDA